VKGFSCYNSAVGNPAGIAVVVAAGSLVDIVIVGRNFVCLVSWLFETDPLVKVACFADCRSCPEADCRIENILDLVESVAVAVGRILVVGLGCGPCSVVRVLVA
jgi:hypothetical protein